MTLSILNQKVDLPSWVGTLMANALGCLILFYGYKVFSQLDRNMHQFIKIGFLGSLTTFSTFAFETSSALAEGRIKEGLTILFLNMFIGIIVGVLVFR